MVLEDELKWVDAADLQLGDTVLAADGSTGTVEAVTIIDAPQVMYNLTIDLVATYVVGIGQWVVHNVNFCLLPYEEHGLSGSLQIAISDAIGQSDPNMLIAVRSRAAYADQFEGLIPNRC